MLVIYDRESATHFVGKLLIAVKYQGFLDFQIRKSGSFLNSSDLSLLVPPSRHTRTHTYKKGNYEYLLPVHLFIFKLVEGRVL